MKKHLLKVLAAVCITAVLFMLVALCLSKPESRPEFTPPPFEESAQSGSPDVPEQLDWLPVQAENSFTAAVCGQVVLHGESADVYFTNMEENQVWLKLRVLDEEGHTLGETGILKPGEYVKTVHFNTTLPNHAKIKLKIMAYEPEYYYSAGSVLLNTTVTWEESMQ